MNTKNNLWQLFKETFMLSAFTLGGGYVIISLMQKRFVEELKWIDEKEMLDLVSIAQSSPGAIAINTSIAVGYRLKKIKGALTAVLATSLPPLIILSALYYLYDIFKENKLMQLLMGGMQIGVTAIVLDVIITMILGVSKQKNWVNWVIFVGAFSLSLFFNINILIVVFVMTIVGMTLHSLQKGAKK